MLIDRFRLDDRVAIVTAAGRGIGAASALAFAESGADVVIAARTVVAARRGRGAGPQARDATRSWWPPTCPTSTRSRAWSTPRCDEFGRLDIVVNNVGGSMPMPFLDTSVRSFEEAFHFNVTTAFALTEDRAPPPARRGQRVGGQHHLGDGPLP